MVKTGKMKVFLLTIAMTFGLILSSNAFAGVIYKIDFTGQPNGSAESWLSSNGFEMKKDADDMKPRFKDGKFVVTTDDDDLGLFGKDLKSSPIKNAKRVRITWGVNKYPKGADWEKGVYREAISVVFFFGTKKADSGHWALPNVPYFISLFLGVKEQTGKKYLGNYYKKGGHYYCTPCGQPTGNTVITEFAIDTMFKKTFGKSKTPPITGITLEIDTRDTDGYSEAFIKKIELLD